MRKILSIALSLIMVLTLMPAFTITANAADTYTLVTNASTLKAGDKVIIAASGYDYAISTTQNDNNRGQAAITKSDNTATWTADAGVQLITVEEGKAENTFAFSVGNSDNPGYLYAAHSSKNYLKTEATLSDNSSWKITIDDETGVASIIAQGSNSRKYLQYNPNNNNPLFACYSTASQKSVCIYRKNTVVATPYTVSFDAGTNGSCATTSLMQASAGASITLPVVTANTDYTFKGWYTAATGGDLVGTAGASYTPTEDITLYAQYGSNFTLSAVASPTAGGSVSVSGNIITATPNSGYTVAGTYSVSPAGSATVTYNNDNTFTVTDLSASATVTIDFAAKTAATVTYYNNGASYSTASLYVGDALGTSIPNTEPTYPGMVFMGWTTTRLDTSTNTEPTYVDATTLIPSATYSLYAVFAIASTGGSSNTYSKITSTDALVSGSKYAIVYEDESFAFNGSLMTLDATNNYVGVTIDNNSFTLTSSTDDISFTITKVTEGYTIQSASDYYIGRTANSNGLNSSETEAYVNTITITSNEATIKSSDGAYLRFNTTSGQDRFRYFKSTSYDAQKPVALYKQQSGTTYSGYQTDFTSAPEFSVTYDAGSGTNAPTNTNTYTEGDTFTVGAAPIVPTGYTFEGWNDGTDTYAAGSTYTVGTGNVSFTAIYNANEYTLSVSALIGGSVSVTLDGQEVTGTTVHYDDSLIITATADAHYTLTSLTVNGTAFTSGDSHAVAGDVTIAATFTADPTYTVAFSVPSGQTAPTTLLGQYAGDSVTLTAMSDFNGYTFAGWIVDNDNAYSTDNTTAPNVYTTINGYTVNASDANSGTITLKAVYRQTTGGSAASLTKMVAGNTLAAGDKIVVVANGTTFGMYQETASSSYVANFTFSGVTGIEADARTWFEVGGSDGKWTLGDEANGYLYTSGSNNLSVDKDNSSTWSLIDVGDGTFKLDSGERYLSCRTDLTSEYANLWRMGGNNYGTTGTVNLDLYKYVAGSGTTYYNTNPVTFITTLGAQAKVGTWDAMRFGASFNVEALKAALEAGDTFNYGFRATLLSKLSDGDLLGTNSTVGATYYAKNGGIEWLAEYEDMTAEQLAKALNTAGAKVFTYDETTITFVLVIKNVPTQSAANIVFRPFAEVKNNMTFGYQMYNNLKAIMDGYIAGNGGAASVMFPGEQ